MDTRQLVVQILNEKDKSRQKMLFGYHKPKLSEAQISFIENKISCKSIQDPLIKYAVDKLGFRVINDT